MPHVRAKSSATSASAGTQQGRGLRPSLALRFSFSEFGLFMPVSASAEFGLRRGPALGGASVRAVAGAKSSALVAGAGSGQLHSGESERRGVVSDRRKTTHFDM